MILALIDCDLITYPCAASCKEEDPLDVALFRVESQIRTILDRTGASEYKLFLTSTNNFRYLIYPEYKANRPEERPKWLQECRAYVIDEWKARAYEWYEADDLLGIYQSDNTLLCSFDKDLLMIPGNHYHWERRGTSVNGPWIKEESYSSVTELEGLRHFYRQMLIGDRTDNIIGIDGIGKVKAAKLIDSLEEEQDMFDLVYNKYNDPTRFLINGACLWIIQNEGETWLNRLDHLTLNDQLQHEKERLLESTKSLWTM